MKTLAILLATTVLFLAFKPAVDIMVVSNCEKISCCAEKCNPFDQAENSSEVPSDDGCDNSCNPFTACGNCFVIVTNIDEAPLQNIEVAAKQGFSRVPLFTSQFLPEFWQPPKLV